MPFDDAANLLCAHGAAHHALKQHANLQPAKHCWCWAPRGTGLAAVQVGKAMGAKVIAICSSDDKLAVAGTSGAEQLIDYSDQDLKATVKELTGGKGVDVVYYPVGGAVFDACTRCMTRNGRLLVIGFAADDIPKLSVDLPLVKEYVAVGAFWGSFVVHEPQRFLENMNELFAWYEQGKVGLILDTELPLSETVAALNKVINCQVKGKIVLIP